MASKKNKPLYTKAALDSAVAKQALEVRKLQKMEISHLQSRVNEGDLEILKMAALLNTEHGFRDHLVNKGYLTQSELEAELAMYYLHGNKE